MQKSRGNARSVSGRVFKYLLDESRSPHGQREFSRRCRVRRPVRPALRLVAALLTAICATAGLAASPSFGHPGEPIRLVAGFNPYFAPAWTLAIVHNRELWKKHLPAGSRVDLEIGLRGPAIAKSLASGKLHFAYFGDAAVTLAAGARSGIRLIAVTTMSQDLCVLVVRADAPPFANAKDGARWLNGRRLATTPGTCQGRITQFVIDRERIRPAHVFNLGRESLEQAFREGRIDAAGVPEPGASDLVVRGLARRLTSSRAYGEWDASFVVTSTELIRARPDIVNGWLEAELDAELFMADPVNADEVVRILAHRARHISERAVRAAIYAEYPQAQGGASVRMLFPFAFTRQARKVMDSMYAYVLHLGLAPAGGMSPDAVDAGWTERVLASRKLRSPVGQVRAIELVGRGS